ncbi:hypothetical protein LLH23_17925 [bacterium]|nr:hypothetical protein [bacterium]
MLARSLLLLTLFPLSAWCAPVAPALDFTKVGIYGVDYDFLNFTNYKLASPDAAPRYAKAIHEAKQRGQIVTAGLYTWDRVSHKKPLAQVFADTDKILDALDLREVDLLCLNEEEVDWQGGFDYLNAIYDHVKSKYGGPVYQWYSMPMGPRWDQKADGWMLDAYGMDYATFRRHLMRFLVLGKPVVVCVNATPGVNTFQCSQEQVRVCEEFNVPVFYFGVHSKLGSVNYWLSTDHPETTRWRSWVLEVIRHCHSLQPGTLPAPEAQFSYADPVELAGDMQNLAHFTEDFATDRFLRQATIHGFMDLAWSGQDKSLALKAATQPTTADLTYHFTSPFALKAPRVKVEGSGSVKLALSADGRTWTESDSLPNLSGRNFWTRITLQAAPGQPSPAVRAVKVTSGFEGPEPRAMSLLPVVKNDEVFSERPEGDVIYRDDFQAPRYLHIGEVVGGQDLQWQPGALSVQGVAGRGVRVEIRQHFASERPLNLTRAALTGMSIGALGGHHELAFSLDGKTPLASATSASKGRASDGLFSGELSLDLAAQPGAQGVTGFWLHLTMVNGAAKATNVSSRLSKLVLTGSLVR